VVHVDGAFSSNELRLLVVAAVRGLGIALLPDMALGDLVASGKLVHVLPGVVEAENRVAVVYPEREFLPPHVRAFVDAVVAWAPALRRDLNARGVAAAKGAARAWGREATPPPTSSGRAARSR
jgi:DNA-binding transcriptional LysR family regulator